MVYHIKFSIINSKFRSTLFKGLQVWAEPIKSFLYIELFGANSLAVCVLRQCLKKQATAFKNVTIKIMHCHCNAMTVHYHYKHILFLLLSQILRLSPLCSSRQTANRLAIVRLRKRKFLWALPTPTTFEKVDQTFIFGTEIFSFAVLCYPTENQLNHNFLITPTF